MHTKEIDENGTDLKAVKNDLCPKYNVIFTNSSLEQNILNEFYNIADCTINIANNEGFGLSTLESVMAGTPIIVNVTGGLQDQCGFNIDGEEFSAKDYIKLGSLHDYNKWGMISHGEWVVPIWPSSMNLNGSPLTPYIFDDRANLNDVAKAIHKVYSWGRKLRKENGLKGRYWALKNLSTKNMCDAMIDGIDVTINNYKPKRKFQLYKIQ
jgi:glycosyltransferase involved in cell wall biosynthesis